MNYKYNGIIEKQNYCVLSGSATRKVLKVWVGHVGNNILRFMAAMSFLTPFAIGQP